MEKLNKKEKRKLYSRNDRFLGENFGNDIKKKIKTIVENKDENEKEEEKNIINENILENKTYRIVYDQNYIKKFIDSLKISDQSVFFNDEKNNCPICTRKKKFYCPDCLIPTDHAEKVPKVTLPFNLKILLHEKEKRSKSSAIPIKILNEKQVEIMSFPTDKLDVFDQETTYFLYPHKNSRKVEELSLEEIKSIQNIVAIECTWNQTNGILKELKNTKKDYKYIQLNNYKTIFWRHQKHHESCLATCEAIYYFYKEYDIAFNKKILGQENYEYDGKYDNLLFYYILQFSMISKKFK